MPRKKRVILAVVGRSNHTGNVVSAPAGVTAYVLWWIVTRLDAVLGRLLSVAGG
jgi:uncharacterized membrane protein